MDDASHVRAPQLLNSLLLDGLVSNAEIELRRHVWDLRRDAVTSVAENDKPATAGNQSQSSASAILRKLY